jgi:hypothetical protein
MFKMFPEHFVPTFFGCSKKVGRKAGMLFEKRHADAARDAVCEAHK